MQEPPALTPWEQVEALDREWVQELFRTAFGDNPVCKLARQMCLDAGVEDPDRLVANNGYELSELSRRLVPAVVMGPDRQPFGADFLTMANRPRPIWTAWIERARAAIEALDKITAAGAPEPAVGKTEATGNGGPVQQ